MKDLFGPHTDFLGLNAETLKLLGNFFAAQTNKRNFPVGTGNRRRRAVYEGRRSHGALPIMWMRARKVMTSGRESSNEIL